MAKRKTKNNIEIADIVNECIEMVCNEGYGWSRYTAFAKEKYGVSRDTANKYWRDAITDIRKKHDRKNLMVVESMIRNLEDIIENGENRDKLKAMEQLAKLGGLNSPDKVEHSGEVKFDFGDTESGHLPIK